MKVKFTPSARVQFLEGLEYIRQDSPNAAAHFRKKTETVLRRLEEFPESGLSIPEFPGFPHREGLVPPYRFFIGWRARRFGLLQFGIVPSYQGGLVADFV